MPSGVKDIRILELKDTILQLNKTISEQNILIANLQKMLEEHNAGDAKKDQLIANLEAQLAFLKQKVFGSTSELKKAQFSGQLSLFDDPEEEAPARIEPEFIEVKGYKKERKPKATYDEMFVNLPTTQIMVDTLTEEQKTCDVCGTKMIPIGHEVIRTEIKYTEPKLERIDYIAITYECPKCKETEAPSSLRTKGTRLLSRAAMLLQDWQHMLCMPSMFWGCHCTGRKKSLNGLVLRSAGQPWRTGSSIVQRTISGRYINICIGSC